MKPRLHRSTSPLATLRSFLAIIAVLCVTQHGRAQSPEDKLLDLWYRFGWNFICVDGQFYRLPDFKRSLTFERPSVGERGVADRCKVLKVRGPDDMIVAAVIPVPVAEPMMGAGVTIRADQMHRVLQNALLANRPENYKLGTPVRLKGFSTTRMVDGQDWSGPDGKGITVAIIGTSNVALTRRGSQTVLLAIPDSQRWQGLSKEQFRELLMQNPGDLGPDRKVAEEGARKQRKYEENARLAKERKEQLQILKEQEKEKIKMANAIEARAARKLKLAESLRAEGRTGSAKRFMHEILDEYPSTQAAKDAKVILKELGN
jgi:hypothetical protein